LPQLGTFVVPVFGPVKAPVLSIVTCPRGRLSPTHGVLPLNTIGATLTDAPDCATVVVAEQVTLA
jgi:hypothetical protein